MAARYSLEELSDQREIEELMHRYATGIDTADYDLIDGFFAPGGTIDYTEIGGPTGVWDPDVKRWSEAALAAFPVRKHYITNTVVSYAPGRDAASSVTYWRAPMGFARGDGSIHLFESGGRYLDSLVRTGGAWRVTARVAKQDWMSGTLPEELTIPEPDQASA
jgi:SnoaL-like protein